MSLTQDRRAWLAGGIVTAVVILAASWFLVISPTFASTSSLRGQANDVQLQNSLLASKIGSLKKQNDNISDLRTQLADAIAALPTGSGLSDFTRQLSSQSVLSGVGISGISVGAAAPISASGVVRVASGSPAGGLYSIPVTITSVGPIRHQFEFLRQIQHVGPRRVLVTSTNFSPSANAQTSSSFASANLTTILSVFSAPTTPAEEAQLTKLLLSSGS